VSPSVSNFQQPDLNLISNPLLLSLTLPLFFLFAIMAYKHQYLLGLKAPQRATGIGCMEHLPIAQDEIGGLKVSVLTIKVGADLLGFSPYVQPVNDRKSDLVLFNHFPGIFLFINRQRDDADICLFELLLLSTKVCKLQITKGSPMSSVEKDNVPFLFQISGDCQTSLSHSRTTHARESITIV